MEVKKFYKELYSDMNSVLKPHGFRKRGCNFRLMRENGIAIIVNLQKSRFNTVGMSSFTINISVCILDGPLEKRSKEAEFPRQTYLHLGACETDGFDNQHWYRIAEPDSPWVTAGFCCCQDPAGISSHVCLLLEKKVVPLAESIQTPEDYFAFRFPPDIISLAGCTLEDCKIFERVYGPKWIPVLDKVMPYYKQEEYLDGLKAIRKRLGQI